MLGSSPSRRQASSRGIHVVSSVKAEQLARRGEELTPEAEKAIVDPILAKYEKEGHAYYSSARLWDDGVIDPVQTRDVLGLGLAMSLNAPIPPVRYGIHRM